MMENNSQIKTKQVVKGMTYKLYWLLEYLTSVLNEFDADCYA